MKSSSSKSAVPIAVRRALAKLGADISAARRRRGITQQLMSERAFTTPNTLRRVERGDPTVSIAGYATVLFVLGMTERLAELADPAEDPVGRDLAEEQLPKRVRPSRPREEA
jgi:transcriptional regulator with XRE-family HTH domain